MTGKIHPKERVNDLRTWQGKLVRSLQDTMAPLQLTQLRTALATDDGLLVAAMLLREYIVSKPPLSEDNMKEAYATQSALLGQAIGEYIRKRYPLMEGNLYDAAFPDTIRQALNVCRTEYRAEGEHRLAEKGSTLLSELEKSSQLHSPQGPART